MVKKRVEYEKLEDIQGFSKEMENESDRGLALLGVAFLDLSFRDYLERHFVADKGMMKEIFDGPTAPLGSFYWKARMAYCLGIFDKDTLKALDDIRNIRNKFAHRLHGLTFNDEPIVSYCENLKKSGFGFPISDDPPREVFMYAIIRFAGALKGMKLGKNGILEKERQSEQSNLNGG